VPIYFSIIAVVVFWLSNFALWYTHSKTLHYGTHIVKLCIMVHT